MHHKNRSYMCIQWTRVIFSVVITWQTNPPIPQFNNPCNEFMSVWSMFVYSTSTTLYRSFMFLVRILIPQHSRCNVDFNWTPVPLTVVATIKNLRVHTAANIKPTSTYCSKYQTYEYILQQISNLRVNTAANIKPTSTYRSEYQTYECILQQISNLRVHTAANIKPMST